VEWLPFPDSIAYHYRAHHYGSVILKFLAVAIFAAFALAVWRAPRGRDFPLVCVAVMTIAAAFVAVRNLPIALLATAIPLARHGAIALNSELKPQQEHQATIYQLMIAVTACELLFLSGLFSPKLNAADPYPVGAVAFMKQHGLAGNILAAWPFGAYVTWHMAPTSRVFIDGRYDTVYPMRVIDDYLAFERGEPAGAATLSKYPHDFVLMQPEKAGAFELLSLQGGWKEVYRDASCVLFVHDGPAAAGLTPITVSPRDTPKNTFP
jgi:membrane protease YdiL (CAAX protease family)